MNQGWKLKLLAVVLAVISWVAVVYAGNPPGERTVSIQVPQSATDIPPRWVLLDPIAPVRLSVVGSRTDLAAFSTTDITVVPNYSGVSRAGWQNIPVTISLTDSAVILVHPPTVLRADFDVLASTTVPLRLVTSPPPPPEFHVDTSSMTPSSVVVSGPKTLLPYVTAEVRVNLANQKSNVEEDLPVVLSSRGTTPNLFGVAPATVLVSITIASAETTRELAVIPDIVGTLPAGDGLTGLTITPEVVTVLGPENLLNALDTLTTAPIPLGDFTVGAHSVTYAIQLPAGILVVNATGTSSPSASVRVTYDIAPLTVPSPSPTGSPTNAPSPSPSPSAGTTTSPSP